MDALERIVREAYDRIVGLELEEEEMVVVVVDCSITKAPCGGGGEKAGRSPVARAKRGTKRSVAVVDARGASRSGSDRSRQPSRLVAAGTDTG